MSTPNVLSFLQKSKTENKRLLEWDSLDMKRWSFHACMDLVGFRPLFLEYVAQRFCSEQSDFLKSCDRMNQLTSSKNKDTLATEIVETFIRPGSSKELNLPSMKRKHILEDFEYCLDKHCFTFDFFKDIESSVLFDLQEDLFSGFVLEDSFTSLMKGVFATASSTDEFKSLYLVQSIVGDDTSSSRSNFKRKARVIPSRKVKATRSFTFWGEEVFLSTHGHIWRSREFMNECIHEMIRPETGVPIQPQISGFFKSAKKREFLGHDMHIWLMEFVKCDDEPPLMDFFNLLIENKIMIPKSGSGKFDYRAIYSYAYKKKVVIVGAGFGGLFVAKGLRNDFDVTVIDPKPQNEYNLSFYKLFVAPTHLSKLETPWKNCIDKCTFVQAEVDTISVDCVVAGGESHLYDYLIISTGSHYHIPFPIHQVVPNSSFKGEFDFVSHNQNLTKIVVPYNSESILSSYPELHSAKSVFVIGAGALGCEIAAEIAYNRPKTKVYLISHCSTVLHRNNESIQKAVVKNLKLLTNIVFLFNRKVIKIEDGVIYCQNLLSPQTELFPATIACICVGFRPNTKMMRENMSDSLSPAGYVQVNNYFQVKHEMNKLSPSDLIEENLKTLKRDEEALLGKQLLLAKSKTDSKTDEVDDSPSTPRGQKEDSGDIMESLKSGIAEKYEPDKNEILDQDQVYPNIFALGDIVDSPEEKLASFARVQGEIVAKNILTFEHLSRNEKIRDKERPYIFGKNEIIMFISTGQYGVFVKGQKVVQNNRLVISLKNSWETLFISQFVNS